MIDLKLVTDNSIYGLGEGYFGEGFFGDMYDYFHDLEIVDGDLQLVSNGPEVVQSVKIYILFIRGDWFLDLLLGLPWFTEMFSPLSSFSRKRSLLKETILNVDGVKQLKNFTFGQDKVNRGVAVTFEVTTEYDTTEIGKIQL